MQDLTIGERLALLPPIAIMFVLGIYPQLVLGVINSTATNIAQQLR
jgi:NADH-quinone oxidoreductase subunit M